MSTSDCPEQCDLALYLLGSLESIAFIHLEAHVDSCPECQLRIEQLQEVSATFDQVLRSGQTSRLFTEEVECQNLVERIQEIAPQDLPAAPPAETSDPPIPAELGPYRIQERLGEGGMGTVYKALHTRLKRIVAVKVLSPHRLRDAKSEARFHREIEAAGALDHPHIVRTSDAGEQEGVHYLVMEYIDGLDLARLIQCHGPLRIADACELICQAANGLQYAHEQGLIHRDIKPSNLILTLGQSGGESSTTLNRSATVTSPVPAIVKVLDFGLARWNSTELDTSELTSADQLMGTLDYMAPEQATDTHQVDIRADIYSLGVTLYKLLTGLSPLDSRGEVSRLKKLLRLTSMDAPSIAEFHPSLPPQLVAVIDQMLSRDPDKRPATPAEVASLLQPFARGADLVTLLKSARDMGNDVVAKPPLKSAGPIGSCSRPRIHTKRRLTLVVIGVVIGAIGLALSGLANRPWKTPAQTDLHQDRQPKSEQTVAPVQTDRIVEPPLAVAPFDEQSAQKLQREWAKYLAVPVEFTNEQGITFRFIPPGEFWMGSSDAEVQELVQQLGDSPHWQKNIRSESPRHRVRLTRPFYLAATSVTHEQFERFMGHLPAHFSQTGPGKNVVLGLDTRRFPVENMSFNEAIQFCSQLNQKSAVRQEPHSAKTNAQNSSILTGYRLPTEAEWEFACRAGTTTRFWSGDNDADLNGVAWTSRRIGPRPNAVGLLRPNPFGLFDMHGNIYQLCADWWTPQYQLDASTEVVVDPRGAATGEFKVARGGDWSGTEIVARSATRAAHGANYRNYYCGFRVALSVEDYRRWNSK